MKYLIIIFAVMLLSSCTREQRIHKYRKSIDSLKMEVGQMEKEYRPGLGEMMSSIQMHHAKLWFAGINNNWKLSEYEIGEIRELIESAKEILSDRPEIKTIPMIYPPIDSIAKAVKMQNEELFKTGFKQLTVTCNACHQLNHFEFNVITVPNAPPVTNQDFKVH